MIDKHILVERLSESYQDWKLNELVDTGEYNLEESNSRLAEIFDAIEELQMETVERVNMLSPEVRVQFEKTLQDQAARRTEWLSDMGVLEEVEALAREEGDG